MVSVSILKQGVRKGAAKNGLDGILLHICTKLDDGNFRSGIGMTVGNDTIAHSTAYHNMALMIKHSQGEIWTVF